MLSLLLMSHFSFQDCVTPSIKIFQKFFSICQYKYNNVVTDFLRKRLKKNMKKVAKDLYKPRRQESTSFNKSYFAKVSTVYKGVVEGRGQKCPKFCLSGFCRPGRIK